MKLAKDYFVLISVIFVFIFWGVTPSLIKLIAPNSNEVGSLGQFGDMFGAFTSLISGLTMVALVFTIFQQQQQIKIANQSLIEQRRETQLTRVELEETKIEFAKQNKIILTQRIEDTFLNLLKSHHDLVTTLNTRGFDGDIVEGIYIFPILNTRIRHLPPEDESEFTLQENYRKLIRSEPSVRTYLNSLNIVLHYIDRSDLHESDAKFYYDIARSHMSPAEFTFLIKHNTLYIADNEEIIAAIGRFTKLVS